ncbi:MAG: RNA 2',3'-cyclic phosphodiesterase [Rhodospirillaceae bacterium]
MRLFVGLELPSSVRRDLAAMSAGVSGAKWVAPENFHITLRFIGQADRHQAADLDAALADITPPAFDLALSGIGSFASRGRLRAVWAGVDNSPPLNHLRDKIERASVLAGFLPEPRKFKPHVTLARFKGAPEHVAQGFLEDHAGFGLRPLAVDRFVLFESRLGCEGAHYTPVETYPLGGAGYDFGDLAEEYAEIA